MEERKGVCQAKIVRKAHVYVPWTENVHVMMKKMVTSATVVFIRCREVARSFWRCGRIAV
jgi:hypothetical protein